MPGKDGYRGEIARWLVYGFIRSVFKSKVTIFCLTIIFFLSDFILKKILVESLSYNFSYRFIDGVVYLRLVYNKGIAFGLFQDRAYLFTALGLVFILFFIIWICKEGRNHNLARKVFLSMILGGGLCNLYDRVFFGYVIDYIDFRWWPVFNLSDSFITVGCLLFVFSVFVRDVNIKRGKTSLSK